jgi:hypothetical protein
MLQRVALSPLVCSLHPVNDPQLLLLLQQQHTSGVLQHSSLSKVQFAKGAAPALHHYAGGDYDSSSSTPWSEMLGVGAAAAAAVYIPTTVWADGDDSSDEDDVQLDESPDCVHQGQPL